MSDQPIVGEVPYTHAQIWKYGNYPGPFWVYGQPILSDFWLLTRDPLLLNTPSGPKRPRIDLLATAQHFFPIPCLTDTRFTSYSPACSVFDTSTEYVHVLQRKTPSLAGKPPDVTAPSSPQPPGLIIPGCSLPSSNVHSTQSTTPTPPEDLYHPSSLLLSSSCSEE